MASILAIVISIVVILLALWLFVKADKPTAKELEVEARLEDELIYDPDSGAMMTLEQAEKGHFIDSDNELRIKSDEEIESNYFDTNREVEYVARFFHQRNIPEAADEELDQVLYRSEIVKQFDKFDTIWLWEYNSEICFAISSTLTSYPGYNPAPDNELMLLVKNVSKLNLSDLLNDAETEQAGEWTIVRFPRSVTFQEFKKIIEHIERTT